jgi:RNA polymerase sigma-70 factor (ECF subfamily)
MYGSLRSFDGQGITVNTLTPEELVIHCRQRLPDDPRAFELLVRQYKQLVFKVAYGMMGNREDAEDQAQEVFLKIYRGIKGLDDPSTLTTWIYRITMNTCLDALRKEKRGGRTQSPTPPEEDEEEGATYQDGRAPTPEEAILRSEVRRCLEETLARLDGFSRGILILRDIEDRPYEEIAKVLGIGLSAVKMRVHRARLAFQQLLDHVCPGIWKSADSPFQAASSRPKPA